MRVLPFRQQFVWRNSSSKGDQNAKDLKKKRCVFRFFTDTWNNDPLDQVPMENHSETISANIIQYTMKGGCDVP